MAEDVTFGGRIEWNIEPASAYTDRLHEQLKQRCLGSEVVVGDDMRAIIERLLPALAMTSGIEFHFDGREHRALVRFRDDWRRHQQMTTEQLNDFLFKLPYIIQSAWITAVNNNQVPFDVDPAQLPFSALTEDQQKDAADPSSPLALPGASSPSES